MKIYWNKENNSKNIIGQRVKELRTEVVALAEFFHVSCEYLLGIQIQK